MLHNAAEWHARNGICVFVCVCTVADGNVWLWCLCNDSYSLIRKRDNWYSASRKVTVGKFLTQECKTLTCCAKFLYEILEPVYNIEESLFCVVLIHCDKSDHRNLMRSGMRVVQILTLQSSVMWRFCVFRDLKPHSPVEHLGSRFLSYDGNVCIPDCVTC
jgi:hypothetical protein